MLVGMYTHMKAAWFFLLLECSARHYTDFRYRSFPFASFYHCSFSTIRYLHYRGFVIYFVSIKVRYIVQKRITCINSNTSIVLLMTLQYQ
jgi:hypothetical protein